LAVEEEQHKMSSIMLDEKDVELVHSRGMDSIKKSAYHFVRTKLAPSKPIDDGEQIPLEGNPVFKAQHATGTDSRANLEKNFGIERGRQLTEKEIDEVVEAIIAWIDDEVKRSDKKQAKIDEF